MTASSPKRLRVLAHQKCDRPVVPDPRRTYQWTCPVCEAMWERSPDWVGPERMEVTYTLFGRRKIQAKEPNRLTGFWSKIKAGKRIWEDVDDVL